MNVNANYVCKRKLTAKFWLTTAAENQIKEYSEDAIVYSNCGVTTEELLNMLGKGITNYL